MNIGFDSYPLWYSKGRGIGNYTLELYKKLVETNSQRGNNIYIFNLQGESVRKFLGKDTGYVEYFAETKTQQIFDRDYVKTQINNFIVKNDIEVFYTPNALQLTLPCYSKSEEWFGNAKLVGTVHDIIPWKMRKLFYSAGGEEEYKAYCENLKNYDLIFCDSNATKEDLAIEFGITNTVNISMSSEIPEIAPNDLEESYNEIRKKIGLNGRYVIFVGGVGINKNLQNILRAYLHSYQKNNLINSLVIVCELNDNLKREIYYFIKRYKLENKLIFTDYIKSSELAALYIHADWCVFPTLYEGFGMPVIEAWKYGLPVLTSDNSSLIEITGDAAVHVNPYLIESIQKGFEKICNMDDKEREHYKRLGQERVKQFSWDKTANMFWNEIQNLMV